MTKREIKPHKGGRTERTTARLTPDEKTRMQRLLKRLKMTLPDYLMSKIEEDETKNEG